MIMGASAEAANIHLSAHYPVHGYITERVEESKHDYYYYSSAEGKKKRRKSGQGERKAIVNCHLLYKRKS